MKLIDVLVRDLDKFGGWPEGAVECHRFADESVIDFFDKDGNWPYDCTAKYGSIAIECVSPRVMGQGIASETVTREQYEAALAASKQEWDGEGLPPMGCECEIKRIADWMPVTIRFISDYHTVFTTFGGTEDCYQTCSLQFRPIRSEEDKKRDEIISAFSDGLGHAHGLYDLMQIYHLMKAGKIPHIRID